MHDIVCYKFREDIRRVIGAKNFGESKVTFLQPVLVPQICHMEMADFAQSATAAYTDRCSSIGQYPKFEIDA